MTHHDLFMQLVSKNVVRLISIKNYDVTMGFPLKFLPPLKINLRLNKFCTRIKKIK